MVSPADPNFAGALERDDDDADAPAAGVDGGLPTRRRQRIQDVARQAETVVGLRRNAEEAAFGSLMRSGTAPAPRRDSAEMPLFTPPATVTEGFEQAVAQRLFPTGRGGFSLATQDREALIHEARRLGISRFDATLLIARVQHYQSRGWEGEGAGPPRHRRRWGLFWLVAILVLLGVQGMLLVLWLRLLAGAN